MPDNEQKNDIRKMKTVKMVHQKCMLQSIKQKKQADSVVFFMF